MENRISRKVDTHLTTFKEDIKEWFNKNNSDINGDSNKNNFLQFIFDYGSVSLSKEDFTRRKRVKNTVSLQIRCCACRANGEQCTRRKKDGEDFCGTHIKGTPYGIVEQNKNDIVQVKKCEIWVQEIKGIQYFIDSNKNIYLHEDILNNKKNPSVIGSYSVDDSGKYSICGELN
jgi:hypothetical protein